MLVKSWWMYLLEAWLFILVAMISLSLAAGAYAVIEPLVINYNTNQGVLLSFAVATVLVCVALGIGYWLYQQGMAWFAPRFDQHLETATYNLRHDDLMKLAMRRVNVNPITTEIALRNIGWLSYRSNDDQKPQFIRADGQIPLEARYLRPYIELQETNWLDKKIVHQIDIEVYQHNHKVVFTESQTHDISKSKNLIIAKTWLPIGQLLKKSPWAVRVRIDGKLLAIHPFMWSKISQQHISAERLVDGEISRQMQRLVNESNGLTGISLDDLLSEQAQS